MRMGSALFFCRDSEASKGQPRRFLLVLALMAWIIAAPVHGPWAQAHAGGAELSAPETTLVQDFFVYCRLASRTELTGNYTRSIAILGSDTIIGLESMIAEAGFVSLVGFIAEAKSNATVKSDRGVLTTLAESVFLSEATLVSPRILGLVRTGQTFRVIESIKGPEGGEPALFHRIELRGRLVDPTFHKCSANSGLTSGL